MMMVSFQTGSSEDLLKPLKDELMVLEGETVTLSCKYSGSIRVFYGGRTEFICCLCVFKNSKDMLLYLFLLLSHILGLTAGDTISPNQDQLTGTEGKSVTMKCNYQTSYSHPELYWYKHDSDLQAPQFILWKGAKSYTSEHIPDKRYESRTTPTSTELIITKLTLADTALYYCAIDTQ
ncbi:hypothetical protein OJAV_G00169800 [Oryzias javanicus]|uniref:Ig-like domain-containing protein n=1 Tax=Oryzias javanicus TaxID=123683 RepID=A0A3S2PA60_ORYJA|nr:hypothetical protein OJAV_G00169800 [Oryzias javanicus]